MTLRGVGGFTQVIDAFRDVQAARSDLERAQNEAQTYANRVVPKARGRAAKIIQDAEAYREQTVAEAKGQNGRSHDVPAILTAKFFRKAKRFR